jgi:hypothetical protein
VRFRVSELCPDSGLLSVHEVPGSMGSRNPKSGWYTLDLMFCRVEGLAVAAHCGKLVGSRF